MKMLRKKKAFTLIEIVLAMILLSILTLGFYSAMVSLYSNSKTEFFITKKSFASVESLEKAATMIGDREITSGNMLPISVRNEIENKVLNKHGDVKYVKPFDLFTSNPTLRTRVDGYYITKEINVGTTSNDEASILSPEDERILDRGIDIENYYVYFVANDQKKELLAPEYEYVKILEKRRASDDGYATDYTYLNNIVAGNTLLAGFKITPETQQYLFFEKYSWELANRKDKDGNFFYPINSLKPANTPILPSDLPASRKGDNYKNGASIFISEDVAQGIYPYGSSLYKNLKRNNKFYKPTSERITHDGYLRFSVEPVPRNMVKLSPVRADAIWVITLPVTEKLLYHFDVSLAQTEFPSKLPDGRTQEKSKGIRDLSKSVYKDWLIDRTLKPVDSTKEINVYRGAEYGEYIELESSAMVSGADQNGLQFVSARKVPDDDNADDTNLDLFMVVDAKNASPGSLLRSGSNPGDFQISYLGGSKFKLSVNQGGGREVSMETRGDTSRDVHIVMLRIQRTVGAGVKIREHFFAVDNNWFDSLGNKAPLPLDPASPIYLGGSNGMRIKEIIAYKAKPFKPTWNKSYALDNAETNKVFNYLKSKYEL